MGGQTYVGRLARSDLVLVRREGKFNLFSAERQGLLLEEHTLLTFSKDQLALHQELLRKRKAHRLNVVRVEGFFFQAEEMCGGSKIVKVYTEHLFPRLSQANYREEGIMLEILRQTVRGASALKSGLPEGSDFVPSAEMIGFNADGLVKMWFNSNFASCLPERSRKGLSDDRLLGGDLLQLVVGRWGGRPSPGLARLLRLPPDSLLQLEREVNGLIEAALTE